MQMKLEFVCCFLCRRENPWKDNKTSKTGAEAVLFVFNEHGTSFVIYPEISSHRSFLHALAFR